MNTDILSLRLQTVVNYIPRGLRIADIGSDHAYLPCHTVAKGIASFAIAGEVVEGPYQSALKQVKLEGLESKISVRKGNGLAVISSGEVDCITICGMGGALITSILNEGMEKLSTIKRLILQPNVGGYSLRVWLLENGWRLIAEEILVEDGKVYEILVAEQGDPKSCYGAEIEADLLFGPFLKKEKNEAFRKKWNGERENWLRIIGQLELAEDNLQNREKKQELLKKVKMVEEVLCGNEEG